MALPLGYPKIKKLSAPDQGLCPQIPERSPSSKFATTPLAVFTADNKRHNRNAGRTETVYSLQPKTRLNHII